MLCGASIHLPAPCNGAVCGLLTELSKTISSSAVAGPSLLGMKPNSIAQLLPALIALPTPHVDFTRSIEKAVGSPADWSSIALMTAVVLFRFALTT